MQASCVQVERGFFSGDAGELPLGGCVAMPIDSEKTERGFFSLIR